MYGILLDSEEATKRKLCLIMMRLLIGNYHPVDNLLSP